MKGEAWVGTSCESMQRFKLRAKLRNKAFVSKNERERLWIDHVLEFLVVASS